MVVPQADGEGCRCVDNDFYACFPAEAEKSTGGVYECQHYSMLFPRRVLRCQSRNETDQ